MKKLICAALVAVAALGLLVGCAGGGKPRGPVDAFVFSSGANPGMEQNAVGSLNMAKDPIEIYVVVPPNTDLRRLVATFSLNAEATISTISSGAKVVQQNGVTPNDFSAPVNYTVETPKDKKPWRYRVTVRLAETNPRLAQLAIGESTLVPSFSARVKSYTATVPFATTKVKVDARGESQYMKSITIDGSASAGSGASASVDFSSGQQKTFLIETLAEDGVSRDEYSVTIVRAAPDRNANLESLEITGAPLVPGFTAPRRAYQVQVPFDATQFVLKARPQSKFSTVALASIVVSGKTQSRGPLTAKGEPAGGAGATVDFSVGDRLTVAVVVTAQDGGVQEYIVDVLRAEPEHINTLAQLSVLNGRMAPAFAPGGLSYVVDVLFASRTVSVVAVPAGKYAKLAFEPGPAAPQGTTEVPYKGDPASKTGAQFDFSATDRLSLVAAVTAQDGKVLRYFIDIRRAPPDSNADLANLQVSGGILSPLFTPRMVSYTVSLPSNIDTVKLTLTPASAVATVAADQPVAQSGTTWVVTVPAAAGKVVPVTVTVTAEDGTQRLYRVNVSREALPVGTKDANARLATLQVSGGTLSPAFDPAVTSYDVKAAGDSVVLNARAESPVATIAVDGAALAASGRAIAVAAGAILTVTVEVTAENGAVSRTTLRVSRDGTPSTKPPAGSDSLRVLARNVMLEKREADLLAQRGETVGTQAKVTVRPYRSNDAVLQETVPVTVRQSGASWIVALDYRSAGVSLDRNRLAEVEVMIPTSGKDSLLYAEVVQPDSVVQVEVPFFVLTDRSRVAWPAVGAAVKVAGYVSMLQPGKSGARAQDAEQFTLDGKGEYAITIEITDPKTGKVLGKDAISQKPGAPRGRTYMFSAPMSLPEGATVGFTLTAQAKSGKVWQVSGTTVVRTVSLDYAAGYSPALLYIADDLSEKK